MLDMNATAAKVRASREATGLGLNVRFLREDGTEDSFSYATAEKANAFRAALTKAGRVVLN
jgi:hypothetical protein